MWRFVAAATLLAFVSACADSANAPELEPSATTVLEINGTPVCPEALDVPEAALALGTQRREGIPFAINRNAGDCSFSSPPITSKLITSRSILVPHGAGPELTFDALPDAVSGFVWQPDPETITNLNEVPIDELRSTTRVDIEMEASPAQTVALDELPLGDYVLEVSARWPDGSSSYAFHVEIVEP